MEADADIDEVRACGSGSEVHSVMVRTRRWASLSYTNRAYLLGAGFGYLRLQRIKNCVGKYQAFPEGHPEGAGFNFVELEFCHFRSGIQSPKKGCCVSSHEGARDLDCIRLERGYCAEVKQVPCLGLIATMPHLLGNDFGGCFHTNRTPLVLDDLKARRRQRGSDDYVHLSFRQLKPDELSGVLVLACEFLGWSTETWIHMSQVRGIGNEKVNIFTEPVIETQHQHCPAAEGPLRFDGGFFQMQHQTQSLGPKTAPRPLPPEIDLRHCQRSL